MKKGVTLIELIFVVVIIGILSAVLVPRFERATLTEAANQIVSHIRYTQHLAMVNNKFDPNDQFWPQTRWYLLFSSASPVTLNPVYTIFSDDLNTVGITLAEIASNPSNVNTVLSGDTFWIGVNTANYTKELDLREKYDVQTLALGGGCANSLGIMFDYLGRPIRGIAFPSAFSYTNNTLIQNQCIITLTNSTGESTRIAIEPETGYTHIL